MKWIALIAVSLVWTAQSFAEQSNYLLGPLAELPVEPAAKKIEPLGELVLQGVRLGMTMDEAGRLFADNWDCEPLGNAEACTSAFVEYQDQRSAPRIRSWASGNPKWNIESPTLESGRVDTHYLSLIFFKERVIGIQIMPAGFQSEAVAEWAKEVDASRTPLSVDEEEMVWFENGIQLSVRWGERPKIALLDSVSWKQAQDVKKDNGAVAEVTESDDQLRTISFEGIRLGMTEKQVLQRIKSNNRANGFYGDPLAETNCVVEGNSRVCIHTLAYLWFSKETCLVQYFEGSAIAIRYHLPEPVPTAHAQEVEKEIKAMAVAIADDIPPSESSNTKMIWQSDRVIISFDWEERLVTLLDTERFAEATAGVSDG